VSALAVPRAVRIELVCFASLGIVASLQWTSLVAEPPAARVLLAVALATAAGAALAAIGRLPWPRARRLALAVTTGAVAICLGLVIVGLPARLLLPVHWGELASNVDRSLHGLTDVPIPYAGADAWTRLVILLTAPLTVGAAAFAAFWPGRRRAAGRIWALVLLIGLYLVAVSWARPDGQLAAGVLLLILVCAWLWLPSLERGRRGAATFAVAAVSVVALPLTALVDPGRSLIDYRGWDLFSAHGLSFSWDQSYGPLDWPQKGTLILEASSDEVHYWKATNLDTFDGVRWGRGTTTTVEPVLGAPLRFRRSDGTIASSYPEWIDRVNFEVRGLTSDFAIGAGTILGIRRVEASPDPDGAWPVSEELEPGDSYSALVYDPKPTPEQMRAAGTTYPQEVGRYVSFTLAGGPDGSRSIDAPLWDAAGPATIAAQVQGTPYESMYGLARQLATGAATPYDAARRIELHLRQNYEYRQDVPNRIYPLPAFLEEGGAGYCQQFSGSMALMLRMLGIPSRVVGGFSPGGRDPAENDYLVDDTDAHNWVEVFFPDIGWVTFEPTPAAAPAGTQVNDSAIDVASPILPGVDATSDPPEQRGGVPTTPTPGIGGPAGGGGDSSGLGAGSVLGLTAAIVALAALAAYGFRAARRARLAPEELAAGELRELERGLAKLGSPLPPGSTLRGARDRLQRLTGPGAAPRYASGLELHRYRNPDASPPSVSERRALRRALISAPRGGSPLRVLLAFPPGGPALSRRKGRAGRTTSRSARPQDPPSGGPTVAPG
jgi:transglutaminase-like putative cysteine protease